MADGRYEGRDVTEHELRIWGLWLNGSDTLDIARKVGEPESRIYGQLHRVLDAKRLDTVADKA